MATENLGTVPLVTQTSVRTKVLSRRADFLSELGDVVLTDKAADDVLRYNKANDTYVITPRKWRKSIKNVESSITSMITTDHFPIKLQTAYRRNANHKRPSPMQTWEKCTPMQKQAFNMAFGTKMR